MATVLRHEVVWTLLGLRPSAVGMYALMLSASSSRCGVTALGVASSAALCLQQLLHDACRQA